jgi:hypothetical protein
MFISFGKKEQDVSPQISQPWPLGLPGPAAALANFNGGGGGNQPQRQHHHQQQQQHAHHLAPVRPALAAIQEISHETK